MPSSTRTVIFLILSAPLDSRAVLIFAVKYWHRSSALADLVGRNMISSKGRSSYCGERSIGYEDAGANTVYFILKAFYEAV